MINRYRLKSSLEPPEIGELAQALADGEWVDMRVVDVGTFERVKIEALHIYQEKDVVTVVQNFRVTPDSGLTQYVLDVDCEDIMYMHPTECEAADEVTPIEQPESPPPDDFDAMRNAAIEAVIDITGGSVMELVKALTKASSGRVHRDLVNQRHLLLWVMFEMSELKPPELCWQLGWRSPMPFQSARYKFTGPRAEEKWRGVITEIVKKAREIGGVEWRREDEGWRDVCILP